MKLNICDAHLLQQQTCHAFIEKEQNDQPTLQWRRNISADVAELRGDFLSVTGSPTTRHSTESKTYSQKECKISMAVNG